MFPALIPALLMLGTFGLERVENALGFHGDPDAIDGFTDGLDGFVEGHGGIVWTAPGC